MLFKVKALTGLSSYRMGAGCTDVHRLAGSQLEHLGQLGNDVLFFASRKNTS
jgi:hypothetical protein